MDANFENNLEKGQNRLEKYDSAMLRVDSIESKLGTSEGHPLYDLTSINKDKYPDFYDKSESEIRQIKLKLANRTFEKLMEQRDSLSDLLLRANSARDVYRMAEEKYLTSDGGAQADEEFESAYQALVMTENEVASIFVGGKKRKNDIADIEQASDENQTNEDYLFDDSDLSDGDEKIDDKANLNLTVSEKRELTTSPAKLAFEDAFLDDVRLTAKLEMSPVPIAQQLSELAMTIAKIRSGEIEQPTTMNWVEANNKHDQVAIEELLTRSLKSMVALECITPEGTLNTRKGVQMSLGKGLNSLIARSDVGHLSKALEALPSIEKVILCQALSVAMKEKLGNPDMDFCSPEVAGSYLSNAMYDELVPGRAEFINWQRGQGLLSDNTPDDALVWKDWYHERDTQRPVDLSEIILSIVERDSREGSNFMATVIDCFYDFKGASYSQNNSMEARSGILHNMFIQLINYADSMDMLQELREFFESNEKTHKYVRIITKRTGDDWVNQSDLEEELSTSYS